MSSILTNTSAMTALQTLKSINKDLSQTQASIATGKTISSATDNASIWAISKVMESDVAGFKAVSDSLALGEATLAVAAAGAEQIVNVLNDIKEKVVAGTGENVDYTKLTNDVTELTNQVTSIIGASQFNGMNLLNDDGVNLTVLSSIDRDSGGGVSANNITVTAVDFTSNLDLSDIDVSDSTNAQASVALIEAHIQTAVDGAAAIGASARRVQDQSEFIGKVTNAIQQGMGALVDTDMEAASARLQALQTQQQLAIQAMSIANQQPQTMLQLFR